MDPIKEFKEECKERIKNNGKDEKFKKASEEFLKESIRAKYSYNFSWMGRPIIQYSEDIMAMQELVWKIKPDLIIETGIAHGGSIIFYASLLELIGEGEVVGVDIDIREHNKKEIENHPMFKRITMFEGSSTDKEIIEKIKEIAKGKKRVMVCVDSNHTFEHVYEELKLYWEFVTVDSYFVVFDTIIENLTEEGIGDRPWGKGNNPMTAVDKFLKENDCFEIDEDIDNKLMISVAPRGYLKRIK